MHILLTNDDGYDAPGIRALWEAARAARPKAELTIVAPSEPYSGKGHVVSSEVRCRDAELDGIGRVIVVEGTPGDCVRVGVALPGISRPDYVLSGVNRGSNLGVDLYYSGTVAAAREATILGMPAAALSQHVRAGYQDDWARTARQVASLLEALLPGETDHPSAEPLARAARSALAEAGPLPAGAIPCFWNINIPGLPPNQEPYGALLVPPSTDGLMIRYDHSVAGGIHHLRYTGVYHDRPAAPGTDVATVFGGQIAISRVPL